MLARGIFLVAIGCAPEPSKVCEAAASLIEADPPVQPESCGDTAELVPVPADGFCEDPSRLVPEDFPGRTFGAIRTPLDPSLSFPDEAAPCDESGRCYEYVVCGVMDRAPVGGPWPVGPVPFGEEAIVTTSGDYQRLIRADVLGSVESIEFDGYDRSSMIGALGERAWLLLHYPESGAYIGFWDSTVEEGQAVLNAAIPGDNGPLAGFAGSAGDYFWTVETDDLQPRLCGLRPDGTLRTVAVLDDDVFLWNLWRRWRLPRQAGSWVYLYAENRICVDDIPEGMAVREEVIFPLGDAPYVGTEPPELPTVHVTDGKHVYFISDIEMCEGYDECHPSAPTFRDGIWRAPVTGGQAEPLFPELPDVADSGLALHAGWLYWAMEADQTVYRTHTETLETQEVFRPSPTSVVGRWGETFFVHAGQLWRVYDTRGGNGNECLVRLDLASLCLPPAAHEASN